MTEDVDVDVELVGTIDVTVETVSSPEIEVNIEEIEVSVELAESMEINVGFETDVPITVDFIGDYTSDVWECYIVNGSTALSSGWLTRTEGGTAFVPRTGRIYVVLTSGAYYNHQYRWNGASYIEIGNPDLPTVTRVGY